MSHTITLYVDGACRGNGKDSAMGGWGAYLISGHEEYKIYGGELQTTNNRMELSAAIEGIRACPQQAKLIIWTDSNYVKQGITEWIHGWKKKNWKDVKNPDLWQALDATCQGRDIEWHWIKGHAGHAGNEMADQLANLGVDLAVKAGQSARHVPEIKWQIQEKKTEPDWLLNDPFGLDFSNTASSESEEDLDLVMDEDEVNLQNEAASNERTASTIAANPETAEIASTQKTASAKVEALHPAIVITPATTDLHGPRQLILDTETTGFYYQDGDRIIEVGAIEMINRKLTGSSIHIYINPKKAVGDSENVHGISDEFLKDKPLYSEIAPALYEYLKGAEIIAHNASFDMNFLDMEFSRAGFGNLSEVCQVTDTLAMAKQKHPGQKNSLDALVRRYEIPARDRSFHGALLDAEILADVYLAMTGGQVSFDMDALSQSEQAQGQTERRAVDATLAVIYASEEELSEHEKWIKEFEQKHGTPCIFAK